MAVPWAQIIQWAPQIISLSRDLLGRSRELAAKPPVPVAPTDELPVRVAALEENERRQAELVQRMAEQQAQLSKAVVALHRRQRMLVIAVLVLAGMLVYALARHP
jgi:hypothetical protein